MLKSEIEEGNMILDTIKVKKKYQLKAKCHIQVQSNHIIIKQEIMEFLESVFFQDRRLFEEQVVKITKFYEEESIVQQYLNQWTLIGSSPFSTEEKIEEFQQEKQTESIPSSLQSKGKNKMSSHKNSIFHNFQKHLITIIKKLIQINQLTFQGFDNSQLAVELWSIFIKGKTQSKKVFQIIFGIAGEGRTQEEINKLVDMFPEFQKTLTQHSIEQIQGAQQMIRLQVASQARKLSKVDIFSRCRVHKCEQFYQYFKTFVHELLQGQVTGRISKTQKQKLIVSLYVQSKLVQ